MASLPPLTNPPGRDPYKRAARARLSYREADEDLIGTREPHCGVCVEWASPDCLIPFAWCKVCDCQRANCGLCDEFEEGLPFA